MKRLCAALVAGALGLAGVLVASPAQAYPNVQVTINSVVEVGGRDITITAKIDPSAVGCTWTLSYNAKTGTKTITGSGSKISHTFRTREVNKTVKETSRATCLYDDSTVPQTAGAFGGVPAAVIAAPATATATGSVTLLPPGDDDDDDDGDGDDSDGDEDDDNGGLPNTGGERLAWLIIGLLLVIAGTTVVVSSRKQNETA